MSNLENLIKHYPEYIQQNLEHIAAYIRPPWWEPTVITTISKANKDEAAKAPSTTTSPHPNTGSDHIHRRIRS